MTPELLFSLSSKVAMGGWLLLIVAGRRRYVSNLITAAVIPLLFAILYTALLVLHWGEGKGGVESLAAVRALFSNDWLLLAGWVHYLAFDLFVGSWQVRDAERQGLSHLLVIPGLVLTFVFGPAGLLVYCGIRFLRGRSVAIG